MVKRSNKHVWVGLGFVFFAVAIAGALYLGARFGSGGQQAPPAGETVPRSEAVLAAAPATIPTDAIVAESPNNSPEDFYAATAGQSFSSSSSGKCVGTIWVFDPIGTDSIQSLSVYNSAYGVATLWIYDVAMRPGLTMTLADAEVRDSQGNGTDEIIPDNYSEPVRMVNASTIKIGSVVLHKCSG